MNIGKLVREKMKLHRTDCSGEYVDNNGKHFVMTSGEDGYTVSYGGDNRREVSVSKEQGLKLAGACRKLELAERTELSKKKITEVVIEAYQDSSARRDLSALRKRLGSGTYKGHTYQMISKGEGQFVRWAAFIDGDKSNQTSWQPSATGAGLEAKKMIDAFEDMDMELSGEKDLSALRRHLGKDPNFDADEAYLMGKGKSGTDYYFENGNMYDEDGEHVGRAPNLQAAKKFLDEEWDNLYMDLPKRIYNRMEKNLATRPVPKFKVGDKVRTVKGYIVDEGKTGIIERVIIAGDDVIYTVAYGSEGFTRSVNEQHLMRSN